MEAHKRGCRRCRSADLARRRCESPGRSPHPRGLEEASGNWRRIEIHAKVSEVLCRMTPTLTTSARRRAGLCSATQLPGAGAGLWPSRAKASRAELHREAVPGEPTASGPRICRTRACPLRGSAVKPKHLDMRSHSPPASPPHDRAGRRRFENYVYAFNRMLESNPVFGLGIKRWEEDRHIAVGTSPV